MSITADEVIINSYDSTNQALKTTANVGDIEIGAVEHKDASSDNRSRVVNAEETSASTEYGDLVRVVGFSDKVGSLTETAPTTDTASSGMNGRLQRIAQRLSTFIAYITAANTARTTGTLVLPVQHVDAAGNVLSASPILGAGEAHLGAVGGNTTTITVTPTLTVAATYVAGDFVGTSGAAMAFANAARVSGGTGLILSAALIDYALQSIEKTF